MRAVKISNLLNKKNLKGNVSFFQLQFAIFLFFSLIFEKITSAGSSDRKLIWSRINNNSY